MKILIYSDLHISKTSSILPLILKDSSYSYRQNMIMKLGKFLSDVVEEQHPDLIINLGDTFDQHVISSYDINVASAFFKNFEKYKDIPHIVLVGNHEMVNTNFNAVELLDNIPNIQVINTPCTLYDDLAFLPYCNYKDITYFPEGRFLFSHQDIQGSSVRGDFVLPDGIDRRVLLDSYKFVFNGHIHKPSIKDNIINVGSIATHSFSDDSESVPQCYIFDTDSLDLKVIKPKHICPLFRKFDIECKSQLEDILNGLSHTDYEYVIQCNCDFADKVAVKELLDNSDMVIASRLNFKLKKESVLGNTDVFESNDALSLNTNNIDLSDAFKSYVENNASDLKFPTKLYLDVLRGEMCDVLEK